MVWKRNETVRDEEWNALLEEYRTKFGMPNVDICRNAAVLSPVCIRKKRYGIILPMREYTQKERRMILEHEFYHIKCGHLRGRRIAAAIVRLNWYRPLCYIFMRQFICQQEIVCDYHANLENTYFSLKEYGYFLMQASEQKLEHPSLMALGESKSMVLKRVRIMTQFSNIKRFGFWQGLLAGVVLTLALLPARVVLAKTVDLQEEQIYASETPIRYSGAELESSGELITEKADENVKVVNLSKENAEESKSDIIYENIEPATRTLFQYREMAPGSQIQVVVSCEQDALYRVGVYREKDGIVSYVEGTGDQVCIYQVTEKGMYTAYVENMSGQTIHVEGLILYQD